MSKLARSLTASHCRCSSCAGTRELQHLGSILLPHWTVPFAQPLQVRILLRLRAWLSSLLAGPGPHSSPIPTPSPQVRSAPGLFLPRALDTLIQRTSIQDMSLVLTRNKQLLLNISSFLWPLQGKTLLFFAHKYNSLGILPSFWFFS